MTMKLVAETEVLRDRVVLETRIKKLDHVVLIRTPEDFEVLKVTDVSLLILPERDARDQGGPLQSEAEELRRRVGVRRPPGEQIMSHFQHFEIYTWKLGQKVCLLECCLDGMTERHLSMSEWNISVFEEISHCQAP